MRRRADGLRMGARVRQKSKQGRVGARSLHFIHHFAVNMQAFAAASCRAELVAYRVLENSMSAVFRRRATRFALWAWALAVVATFAAAPARADTITVAIDRAQVMRLPERVATIVIGNPLIADASLQRGGVLVVTGKGYGTTNLLALDREGHVVMNKTVRVLGPHGGNLVVVYRGVDRESYSCTPECEPRITLGDAPAYFNPTLAQSGARAGQAKSSAH
jgi:Pilus formation protein N terminal region